LAFEIIFPIAVLISGIVLLAISSDKAVEHSIHFASALGVSSLMIGLVLVSIGTDLPEMANSIISCWSGHGDIDLGDSLGSILTQITLVLGIIALMSRKFKVKRREILVIGSFTILGLILAVFVALTGFTREKAFALIASWPIFILIMRKATAKDVERPRKSHAKSQTERHYLIHLTVAILGFVGVGVGALAVVQSVIALSSELNIPEFFISFFVVGLGTSIPELVVDLTAIRKRQYELAIGDIIGSCLVDATVSLSIGQLFFPTALFLEPSGRSVLLAFYAIFACSIVILTLALREKVDRKSGAFFILVYSVSYSLLFLV
jgi:cation:H+ antiporter